MVYRKAQIKEFRERMKRLRVDCNTKHRRQYIATRDAIISSFEKSYDKTNDNELLLKENLYKDIWGALLPNERLVIEHLYYEDPALADKNSAFYQAMYDYIDAKEAGNKADMHKCMHHALWELRYTISPNKVIALCKNESRRMAQSTMLNSLGIYLSQIHIPDTIAARVRKSSPNF
jgi:hypothetical protein